MSYYIFTPLTVDQAGVEDNGHLWISKPGCHKDREWVCTCHKDDWAGIALGHRLKTAYESFEIYPAEDETWRSN